MADNRHARQILAFGSQGQKQIEVAHVGIVGLGGIGSHIAQGLAYLGVGSFVLVDDDRVEVTNLNRLIGAGPADAEAKVPKAAVAERLIRQTNPDARVVAMARNLRTREAIEALISCPVIFGCVDNDGARLVLMELAAAYEATLIDCATEIIPRDGRVPDFGGRVVVARPGDFCLDCAQEIDMEVAKQELESPSARELRRAHGYGLGKREKAPSVVSLNGIIANIAVTEFLMMTTGVRAPYRYLIYYGDRGKVNVRDDKRRDDCYTCGAVAGSRERTNIFRYILQDPG